MYRWGGGQLDHKAGRSSSVPRWWSVNRRYVCSLRTPFLHICTSGLLVGLGPCMTIDQGACCCWSKEGGHRETQIQRDGVYVCVHVWLAGLLVVVYLPSPAAWAHASPLLP